VALTNLFAFRSKLCIACSIMVSSSHSLPCNLSDFLYFFFSQAITQSEIQTHPLNISSRLDLQKRRRQGNLTKVSSLREMEARRQQIFTARIRHLFKSKGGDVLDSVASAKALSVAVHMVER
jgi:hypothetical protein